MEGYLTTAQVCEILKVSWDTVRKMELNDRLHPIKHISYRSKLYKIEEIEGLVESPASIKFDTYMNNIPKEERVNKPLSQAIRFFILNRDKFRCCACGRNPEEDDVKLEVDHKLPKAFGGTNDTNNLWTLCHDCNIGKSNQVLIRPD